MEAAATPLAAAAAAWSAAAALAAAVEAAAAWVAAAAVAPSRATIRARTTRFIVAIDVHRKEVVLHSRAIGVVTVMARAEPEADCRMVLETRHDYGDDLDAYENVIVNASGLAVVEELSMRCAVQRLVSEECLPLAVHPRSRPEGRRTESLPPSQPLTVSHSVLPLVQYRDLPAREPVSQFSH